LSRSKVEQPFRVTEQRFDFVKKAAQLATLFALSSPWMARQLLVGLRERTCGQPGSGSQGHFDIAPRSRRAHCGSRIA
jgi:hypothetical protein